MATDDARRPSNLRVIPGGRTRRVCLEGLPIVIAPPDTPPFDLDARVYEEDTYRILSAAPEWAPPEEHPVRIMNDLQHYEPDRPGSVVVQAGRPRRLLAIVHDVNCLPTWRPEWIETALRNVLKAAARHHLVSIGLPLLGRRHGRLPRTTFIDLLAGVLVQSQACYPRRLWLIVSGPESAGIVFEALRGHLPDGATISGGREPSLR